MIEGNTNKEDRIDLLSFQLKELDELALTSGEYDSLNSEFKKISNIEKAINFFETFFDNDATKIPKEFKKFKALFQKNNLSRKECILLPFKTLSKALKS